MKYGFFNDETREYVITRPDTPAPWVNYLGSPAYGAIISNNAGGYADIHSEALYYVPIEKEHEVWALTVTNCSDRKHELTLTGYAEFTNHSNYEQDQVNLQYSLFITRTQFEDNRIMQKIPRQTYG